MRGTGFQREGGVETTGYSPPELVVLDIVMPMMDGMQALGKIMRKESGVSVILNTAHPSCRDDFMSRGADACVVKLGDLEELKGKVQEIFGESRSQ